MKWVSVAGQLGEEFDVSSGHHPAAQRAFPDPHGSSSLSAVRATLAQAHISFLEPA
jgi:hypothetical protein